MQRWLAALAVIFLLAHFAFLSPTLEDIDSINFALGLRHFDVAAHPSGGQLLVVTTVVDFIDLDDSAVDAYIATGEPFDKAGGYAIQGAGGRLVSAIDGSQTTAGTSTPVAMGLSTRVDPS